MTREATIRNQQYNVSRPYVINSMKRDYEFFKNSSKPEVFLELTTAGRTTVEEAMAVYEKEIINAIAIFNAARVGKVELSLEAKCHLDDICKDLVILAVCLPDIEEVLMFVAATIKQAAHEAFLFDSISTPAMNEINIVKAMF